MRRIALALLAPFVLAWLTAAATAAVPTPSAPGAPALSASELAALGERRVVVRPDLGDGAGGTGSALGIVDVRATPDATIDAILDLPARIGEITGLRAARVYEQSPAAIAVAWEVRMLATSVVFHVRYEVDRARGAIVYALDPTRPNDLVRAEGAYRLYPEGASTRLVYRGATDSGRSVPEWLARRIATASLTQQLEGIRARAEAR